MATEILYPAVGHTVLDKGGNVIPSHGIGPVEIDEYYGPLAIQGLLLRVDRLASGEPPALPPGPQSSWEYEWTWTNATERTATAITTSDIGKRGYQSDMQLGYAVVSDGAGGVLFARQDDPRFPFKRFISPINNSLLATVHGVQSAITSPIGSGVSTRNASAGATRATRQTRLGSTTAGTANSVQAIRWGSTDAQNNPCVPSAGFRSRVSTVVTAVAANLGWNTQAFTGAAQTANANPNTHLDFVGMGRGAEANVQIYCNDGAGAAAQVDCGASFPAATAGEGYELEVLTLDGTAWVAQVTRVNTGQAFSTTFTSGLPTSAQGGPAWFQSNFASAVACQVDIVGWVGEFRGP